MFVSYAQNGEDVVLWRALRAVEKGTYVDVGAAEPTFFSVTKAFYDRGWSGLNVEPAPQYAELLEQERPRDVTVRCGASDVSGETIFHVVEGTGLSTLDESLIPAIIDAKYNVSRMVIDVKPLGDILADAGFADRDIHFLKVDVEGAEAQVLEGLDLQRWRPWVIVVEATRQLSTEQTHDLWEKQLLDAGYVFCLFDGLNRFYASPDHEELAAPLSYPAGVFDQPYRAASLDQVREEHVQALEAERMREVAALREQLAEQSTISARVAAQVAEHVTAVDAQLEDHRIRLQESLESERRALNDAIRWYAAMIGLRHDAAAADHQISAMRQQVELALIRQSDLEAAVHERDRQIEAIAKTVSWRLTRPLRVVRRVMRRTRPTHPPQPATAQSTEHVAPIPTVSRAGIPPIVVDGCRDRLDLVSALIDDRGDARSASLVEALARLECALSNQHLAPVTRARLALLAVQGRYPDTATLEDATRVVCSGE